MRNPGRSRPVAVALGAAVLVAACTGGASQTPASPGPDQDLAGNIRIDGSSTVYPVSEAIAEEFQAVHPKVRVSVAFSGTGGGFKKFCNGETDANDASRPIKDEELETCRKNGVEPVELKVAIDALSVVVNPANDWATCMTVEELKKLWDQGSTIKRWNEIRPEWPNEEIKLFGPGADSGTFDYFTEVINGEAQRSRSDYTQSEDDNTLVLGVEGDKYALGYFGYAYFIENADRLKDVAIDGGNGCVEASPENVNNGTYTPLARPLFVYPSKAALARPEVAEFFRFYLDTAESIVGDVGYIALPEDQLAASKAALEAALE
ncbi:MAG TPA: PstS family phosphate ABC transporter substrate-binding protein [Candidatus Binatia bacterium]|nr:PstS family phosphate ABC transporter substrate-binding protein [Candidatus Binatia bacterium]